MVIRETRPRSARPRAQAEFQYTPTIAGQAKLAAAEWKVLEGFLKE